MSNLLVLISKRNTSGFSQHSLGPIADIVNYFNHLGVDTVYSTIPGLVDSLALSAKNITSNFKEDINFNELNSYQNVVFFNVDFYLRLYGIEYIYEDSKLSRQSVAIYRNSYPNPIDANLVLLCIPLPSTIVDAESIENFFYLNLKLIISNHQLVLINDVFLLNDPNSFSDITKYSMHYRASSLMRNGVRLDPWTLQINGSLVCANGVSIGSNVEICDDVVLGENVAIGPFCILRNCSVADNVEIKSFTTLDGCSVGSNTFVGPYARIRPGTSIGSRCQIGNFVEIKNSEIHNSVRINHHSFIGDSHIFDGVTIGAGVITCNHNGVETCNTIIEEGAYVGSGCNLIAPITIGKFAIIGAGSTLTKNAPPSKITIARHPQIVRGSNE